MASNPAIRPTYTGEQVREIYKRLEIPQTFCHEPNNVSRAIARGPDGLKFLTALKMAMLTAIPFENLDLHYSPHRTISLDPAVLYDKFITQGRGRGGYCMENNTFFGTLLRSIGFQVKSVGARASQSYRTETDETAWRFPGWSHMVNLVKIEGANYLVDVGYGPGGPTHPLPLIDGRVSMNVAPNQHVRLRHAPIPDNEDQDCKLWIYERRNAEDDPFNPVFCFPDNLEFLPGDFEVFNYRTSTSRTASMTYQMICAKFIMDEQTQEMIGETILFEKTAYRRIRGQKQELCLCKTETDRIQALEEHLGVTLTEIQKNGIKGTVTALPVR